LRRARAARVDGAHDAAIVAGRDAAAVLAEPTAKHDVGIPYASIPSAVGSAHAARAAGSARAADGADAAGAANASGAAQTARASLSTLLHGTDRSIRKIAADAARGKRRQRHDAAAHQDRCGITTRRSAVVPHGNLVHRAPMSKARVVGASKPRYDVSTNEAAVKKLPPRNTRSEAAVGFAQLLHGFE